MADIPYIPVPEQPRTTGQPILADPSAASAPWRAVAQVGQDIQGLGKMVFSISKEKQAKLQQAQEKKQNLIDRSGVSRVGRESTHTVNIINAEIGQDSDPDTWIPTLEKGWESRDGELNEWLSGSGMSDEMKEVALQDHEITKRLHREDVALKAETRRIELLQQEIVLDAEDLVRQGDIAGAEAKIKELELPEADERKVIQQTIQKGEKEAAYETLRFSREDGIEAVQDFIVAIDKKTDGKYELWDSIEQDERRSLRNQAKQELRVLQAEFYDSLIYGITQGDIAPVDKIKQWKESGRLDTADAARYIDAYHKEKDQADLTGYGDLVNAIANYDPATDPSKEQYTELQRRILGQPKEVTSDLRSDLHGRLKGTGEEEGTALNSVLKAIGRMHTAHFFSDGDDPEDDTEMILKAETKRLAMERQARTLATKHPDMTEAQIMDVLFAPGGAGDEVVAKNADKIARGAGRGYQPADPSKGAANAGNATFNYLAKKVPGIAPGMTRKEAYAVAYKMYPEGVPPIISKAISSYYAK